MVWKRADVRVVAAVEYAELTVLGDHLVVRTYLGIPAVFHAKTGARIPPCEGYRELSTDAWAIGFRTATSGQDLIVLDDWGLAKLTAEQRRDLLELLDDRHGNRSTLVTSQLPVDHWHDIIGDPTLADAILDRLIHNAYRINLKGESLRKRHAKLTATTPSE